MLNVVVLVGRLVRDPELRYTPNGIAVGTFTIAVNRPFSSRSTEQEADFIDIVVWRGLAETVAQHLQKGRLVAVNGRLQIRSYETSDGQRRRVAEVVANDVRFLDRPRGGNEADDSFDPFAVAEDAEPSFEDDFPF